MYMRNDERRHRSELKWRTAPPGVGCLQGKADKHTTHGCAYLTTTHNAPMCNNQQINLCPPNAPRPNTDFLLFSECQNAILNWWSQSGWSLDLLLPLHFQREAEKNKKSAPLWVSSCHLYLDNRLFRLSRRNFPHGYSTEVAASHVYRLVYSPARFPLLLSSYVTSWSNESIP